MAANGELHDLAPGYALGVLDEREREAFEEHLEECESCRDEVGSLGDAATALAYAAEGPQPPAELRERILSAARTESRKVVPLRRRWTPVTAAAIAAAACLALGLGLWATLGTGGDSKYRAARVALKAGAATVGTLEVAGNGAATLTVTRLDPPPAGKGYEIWVIEADKAPADAGFFRHGGENVQVRLERKVPRRATVAVTIESARVDAPTTKPVMAASIST